MGHPEEMKQVMLLYEKYIPEITNNLFNKMISGVYKACSHVFYFVQSRSDMNIAKTFTETPHTTTNCCSWTFKQWK